MSELATTCIASMTTEDLQRALCSNVHNVMHQHTNTKKLALSGVVMHTAAASPALLHLCNATVWSAAESTEELLALRTGVAHVDICDHPFGEEAPGKRFCHLSGP